MPFKRKLKKGEVFLKDLFNIMCGCRLWAERGECATPDKVNCCFLPRCAIVRKYDQALVPYLRKGLKTPYLPNRTPGVGDKPEKSDSIFD